MFDSAYSINIERAVLSSILFDYEIIDDIMEILQHKDFYLPAHQVVYETMVSMHLADLPIDEDFLRRKISARDLDDSILIEILSANSITNTKAYVLEIKESATKRELASLATTIKKVAIEEDMSASEALDTVQDELYKISETGNKHDLKSMEQIVKEFEESLVKAKDAPAGLKTGIRDLDRIVTFEPGDLVIIAARPSMGKTSLLVNIIDFNMDQNIGVLFDSLEMPDYKIMRRFMACHNEESLSDLGAGVFKDHNKYIASLKYFSTTRNLIIHDKSFVPVSYLKAKAKKIFSKNPHIKIWAIDHLRFIKSKGINRPNEVSDITKTLKSIGKEFGVVVILLCQLGRGLESRGNFRPMLSDLRESGSVEEDADIIIFPHRESYYKRTQGVPEASVNEAEIIVGKNRDGESGTAKTQFNGPFNKFGSFPLISYTSGDNVPQNNGIQMESSEEHSNINIHTILN